MKYGIMVKGTIITNEKILEEAMKIMVENFDNQMDVCNGLECEKCAFRNKKYCPAFCIFYEKEVDE